MHYARTTGPTRRVIDHFGEENKSLFGV